MNGKKCIDGVREDFPEGEAGAKIKCRWWQHLYGKDPQTEGAIDQWDCAIAWLPITTIETAQMSRQTSASVDKTANVLHEVGQAIARQAISTATRTIQLETVESSQIPGPEAS